jgi:thiol-disulfide isomerase/thioredoxin
MTAQRSHRPDDPGRGAPSRRPAWLAVVLVVGLVALATQRTHATRSASPATTTAVHAAGRPTAAIQLGGPLGAAVDRPSPTIAVPTLAGATFRLPAGRPAVVYFMAAWCQTCQAEAAALAQIQQRDGERVAILAVDVDPGDRPAAIRAFFHAVGAGYQVARDPDGWLAAAFAVQALDTTVVVNPAGRVVWRDAVPTGTAALQAALRTAGLAR